MTPEEIVESVQAVLSSRWDFEPSAERDAAALVEIEKIVGTAFPPRIILNGEGTAALSRLIANPNSDEFYWEDRATTYHHVFAYRSRDGRVYETDGGPYHPGDVRISRREEMTISGTIVGNYPEIGDVQTGSDGISLTVVGGLRVPSDG